MAKEKTNYTEPEEVVTEGAETNESGSIPEMKDPLAEPVIDRAHTTSGIGKGTDQPMPEYTINPDATADQPKPEVSDIPGAEEEEEIPSYEEIKAQEAKMTPQDLQENAEATAEMLMEGYSWLWNQAGTKFTTITEKNIKQLQKDGVFLGTPCVYGNQKTTIGGAIQIFNSIGAGHDYGLSEKERNALRRIIAAELAKRGLIMKPWMYALFILGKHGARNGKAIRKYYNQKQTFMDQLSGVQESSVKHTAQPPVQPSQQAPPPPQEVPAEQVQQAATETMEETTGYANSGDRAEAIMRNIHRQNRQAAQAAIVKKTGKKASKSRVKKSRVKKVGAKL